MNHAVPISYDAKLNCYDKASVIRPEGPSGRTDDETEKEYICNVE